MGWRGMLIATLLCLAVLGVAQVARRPNRSPRDGRFLMVDDFHNEREWATFMAGIHKNLPDREAIEIPDDHAAWQLAYDLRQRYHMPGYQVVYGQEWERGGIGGDYRKYSALALRL